MKEKCKSLKKSGAPCLSWAMPNGYCRRHGGLDASLAEEEKVENQDTQTPVEAVEAQEEKPAKQRRKRRKRRKRKPKQCGALTTKGTACTFKVLANGRCGKHQGAPDAPPEILSKDKEASTSPQTYINSLVDEGEEKVFKEYFKLLHKDFNLNSSSDRMNAEIACLYYVKLMQAIKSDDAEAVSRLDQLFRNKLEDLKNK